MSPPKRFVYILRSRRDPTRYYTGVTSNVAARLDAHNADEYRVTFRWELGHAYEVRVEDDH